MITVNPSLQNNNLKFKSNNSQNQNYPKTKAGLYTGITTAALVEGTVMGLDLCAFKSLKKFGWGRAAGTVAAFVGSGALIDLLINNKFKKGEKNNAIGKKYGSALGGGLGFLLALSTLGKSTFTSLGGKVAAGTAVVGAIGGFILGAITDKLANKKAEKF